MIKPKRWPVIRLIRYAWLAYRLDRHIARCRALGIGLVASESDLRYLKDVRRGDA